MTGKPEDDGLAEIKRLLRSLDETSAGEPPRPSAPRPPGITHDPRREMLTDRPLRDAIVLAPPEAPLTLGIDPPPPPAARSTAISGSRSSPWPLAMALITGTAAAAGAAIWWTDAGLLPAQLLNIRTTSGSNFSHPQTTSPKVARATVESPPVVDAAPRAAAPPPPAESAPPASLPPRIAQAVRTQSAISDAPPASKSEPELRLRIPARLTATAGQSAPLPIEIDGPGRPTSSSILLVKGLPPGITLSKGAILATGDWSLPTSDATGLTMTLRDKTGGHHQLVIEMRSDETATIASVRTMLEVADAPSRSTMSDAVRPPEATTLEWLVEAKRLMTAGHIASSRLLLERAADAGLAEAARLLGDTYDPAKLYVLGVRGVSGDIQKAINWYERADELGDPQAKARLLGLSGGR